MSVCRDPRHCLIPPTVLERIARNGNDEQRAWALGTLLRDQTIRSARIQNAGVRAMGPREGADALAVSPVAQPDRRIYDAKNTDSVQGTLVRREGDGPTGDLAVDEAYDGLGSTFKFFNDVYERNSIDDAGMPLRGVVHFGQDYANAFWDGRRMVFGDGDNGLFGRMTMSLDVIGHELSHGVVEDESGLEYMGQSGALNESWADVGGSLVKQYSLNQKADAGDWLIGNDIFSPAIQGDALRSLKAPGTAYDDPVLGKDRQPGHMRDYVRTTADNGGVHINSGIPNHAFYTVATTLGGFAWERAGLIWYESLQHPACVPTCTFARFARITMRVTRSRYGENSAEMKAVREGWDKVGVTATTPAV
jgi:Zn-dependent metalloprotease